MATFFVERGGTMLQFATIRNVHLSLKYNKKYKYKYKYNKKYTPLQILTPLPLPQILSSFLDIYNIYTINIKWERQNFF